MVTIVIFVIPFVLFAFIQKRLPGFPEETKEQEIAAK